MSRKNAIHAYKLFNGETTITADTISSEYSTTTQVDQATVPLSWTGNLAGTLTVEVANTDVSQGEPSADTVWRALDFGTPITIDDTDPDQSIELVFTAMPFSLLRLNFDYTSGSGTILAVITAKSV